MLRVSDILKPLELFVRYTSLIRSRFKFAFIMHIVQARDTIAQIAYISFEKTDSVHELLKKKVLLENILLQTDFGCSYASFHRDILSKVCV